MEDAFQRHGHVTGTAILLVCLLFFHSNRGFLNAADSRAVVDLAWWMSQGKGFTLDGHPNYRPELNEWGYWAARSHGKVISLYPAGTSVLAAPFYTFMRSMGAEFSIPKIPQQAKTIASILMAASCWALWLVFKRLHSSIAATITIGLIAFGSMIYSSMAQALWIQTGALFCQAMSILLLYLISEETLPRYRAHAFHFLAGVFAGWAAVCRPGFILWPFCLFMFVLLDRRRRLIPFAVGLMIAGTAGLLLNKAAQGSWLGSYVDKASGVGFEANPLKLISTAAALLFSPSRGLTTFFPWTALILAGAVIALANLKQRNWWVTANLLFFLGSFLLLCSFKIWWGGYSSGPRLQCDLLFSGLFLAASPIAWLTRRWWGIPLILLLFIPSAFIAHRQARLLQYPWEAATPRYESHLDDWKRGNLRWLVSNGRIHRLLRGESSPVRTSTFILNHRDPNVKAYLESGIWPGNNTSFQMTARTANVIFSFDSPYNKSDLLLAVHVHDNLTWGHLRHVAISMNGQEIGTLDYISGSGRKAATFSIDKKYVGQKPYDRLTITESYPPQGQFGDEYLMFDFLVIMPEDHPDAQQIRKQAAPK